MVYIAIIILLPFNTKGVGDGIAWGFRPHQRINQLAIYTLPYDLLPFYKTHTRYISQHAVDPDRRRYSSPHEAIRHYVDLDYWEEKGVVPPLYWTDFALSRYRLLHILSRDTLIENRVQLRSRLGDTSAIVSALDTLALQMYGTLPQLMGVDADLLLREEGYSMAYYLHVDGAEHGIVPYHIQRVYAYLVHAFENHDWTRVVRLSADIGHYVADAHVPLHTTSNYNGQKSGQLGIHAFWETRIPEVMEDSFDLFCGKADYIDDLPQWVWKVVRSSYEMVDSVLSMEREAAAQTAPFLRYSIVERNGRWERKESSIYARRYAKAMNGMVERRMCSAIRAVGSIWLTAWVDAGQPVLPTDAKELIIEEPPSKEPMRLPPLPASCHPD